MSEKKKRNEEIEWSVVYKTEGFGKIKVLGKNRDTASQKVLDMNFEELCKLSIEQRIKLIGIVKTRVGGV
jgi:hypothetical protein